MSRGREANHLYLASDPNHEPTDLAPRGEEEDPLRLAARRLGRSRGKTLALDEFEL